MLGTVPCNLEKGCLGLVGRQEDVITTPLALSMVRQPGAEVSCRIPLFVSATSFTWYKHAAILLLEFVSVSSLSTSLQPSLFVVVF